MLVIVTNGYIAHGKNALELAEHPEVPGLLPEPVLSPTQLPTGVDAPEHGTMGIVGIPGIPVTGAGAYQYVATLPTPAGDEYPIDEWVRTEWFMRGLALMVDSVASAPLLINAIDGDTVGILDTIKRNWNLSTTFTSTILDGANSIDLTADGGDFARAALDFPNLIVTPGKPTLVLMRASRLGGVSTNPAEGAAALATFHDGIQVVNTTWNLGNILNNMAFYSPAGQKGAGNIPLSINERVDYLGQLGSDPTAAIPELPSGKNQVLSFNSGYVPGSSDVSLTYPQADLDGTAPTVILSTQSGLAPNSTAMSVQKIVGLTTLV